MKDVPCPWSVVLLPSCLATQSVEQPSRQGREQHKHGAAVGAACEPTVTDNGQLTTDAHNFSISYPHHKNFKLYLTPRFRLA